MFGFFQTFWGWLTSSYFGKVLASLLVSMLPVVELRGGIPIAVGLGLDPHVAIPVCIFANIIPIIPVILLVKHVFHWVSKLGPTGKRMVDWMERRVNRNRDILDKYAWVGLVILTAIPAPGTGAWTASMLAGLTDVRIKHAFPAIALGVVIAALIVGILSYGVAAVL
jgi:uncharacterized membrane protein